MDYLTKPIKPSELSIRVKTALRLRALSAERDDLVDVLRHQRNQLQRTALQHQQLSAFLVHDLKNPVSGIRVAGQLLLADAEASQRTRQLALRIQQAADSVLEMIGDLLDIAKADDGLLAPVRSTIALGPLVQEVLASVASRAEARSVSLRSEIATPEVPADPTLIRRVLENLIDNALRHAPTGSSVTLTADVDAGGVVVRVRDAGPGVPPEDRVTIFERFVQGNGAVGRVGRGLGLAFCSLAVGAHGGRVWVEDGAPGAVFCIWLPDTT
jgi:signal transduction histidine kinase